MRRPELFYRFSACLLLLLSAGLVLPACQTAESKERPEVHSKSGATTKHHETSEDTSHWPTHDLKKGDVEMTVYLPDWEKGFYRGKRFDHSGIVARVEYDGHKWFGPFQKKADPTKHDNICGPAEEFGIDSPAGFAEAKEGEGFIKIGVGVLKKVQLPKKDVDKYLFYGDYPLIEQGTWKVTSGEGWIQFRQKLTYEDYGYDYVKRIELQDEPAGFAIEHTLTNTGRVPLVTQQYCHNFTIVDDAPIGPNYSIKLPFNAPQRTEISKGRAIFEGNTITIREDLAKGSIWAKLEGYAQKASDHGFVVRNSKLGVGLACKGDQPISQYRIYGVARALCPEPFIAIDVKPGKSMNWTSQYTLLTGEDAPIK